MTQEQFEQRTFQIFSLTKNRRVAHAGGQGNNSVTSLEYARRIVACLEACKGIETEVLEARSVEPCDICGAASHNLRANKAEARAEEAERLLRWAMPLAEQCLEEVRQKRLQAGHRDIGAGTDHFGLWPDEAEKRNEARAHLAKHGEKP